MTVPVLMCALLLSTAPDPAHPAAFPAPVLRAHPSAAPSHPAAPLADPPVAEAPAAKPSGERSGECPLPAVPAGGPSGERPPFAMPSGARPGECPPPAALHADPFVAGPPPNRAAECSPPTLLHADPPFVGPASAVPSGNPSGECPPSTALRADPSTGVLMPAAPRTDPSAERPARTERSRAPGEPRAVRPWHTGRAPHVVTAVDPVTATGGPVRPAPPLPSARSAVAADGAARLLHPAARVARTAVDPPWPGRLLGVLPARAHLLSAAAPIPVPRQTGDDPEPEGSPTVEPVPGGEGPVPTSVPAVIPGGGPEQHEGPAAPAARPTEAEWSGRPGAEPGTVHMVHQVSTTPAPAETVARFVGNASTVLLALLGAAVLTLRLTVGWPRFPEPYLGRRRAGGDRGAHG